MEKIKTKIRISFYDQISKNKLKSFFLMFIIFLIFLLLGWVIGSSIGSEYFTLIMIIAVLFSTSYLFIMYYSSSKIALASVNAKPAKRENYPQYHNSVEGLCLASGLPKPKLYIMENDQINAFASGRNPQNSIICITTGTFKKLEKSEIEGILAHELSHIASYDIRFMTLVAVMVGMISIISQIFLRSLWFSSFSSGRNRNNSQAIFMIIGIVFAILAPITVFIIQLAISRKREYAADASAVKFIRSPTGLIKALKKINFESKHLKLKEEFKNKKVINKAIAPLFFSDPFRKKMNRKKDNLFATHPPIRKRIQVLERM